MVTVPARVQAFINEANVRAPGRRTSSDGTYVNKPGDHNVDYRGINHAGDLSQSMPGTPYWKPRFQQFDVHAWQRKIAAQYIAADVATRARRWPWLFDGGYMHSYDYTRKVDVIFTPTVSPTWRVDNNPPSEHIQHGHFSIGHTVRSENDTQPIFVDAEEDDDMTPAEFRALMDGPGGYREQIKSDTNAVAKARLADTVPDLVEAAVKKYVEDKLGGYVNGTWKPDALADKVLPEARKKYGLSS